MSTYSVHRLCADLQRDPTLRAAMQTAPDTALQRYRLTDQERRAILDGDVATLHRLGVHGYLLSTLGRLGIGGLTLDRYVERITRA